MTSSVDGLVSGLDTTALINQLITAEKAPQDQLVAKRDKAKQVVAAYQSLNTKLAALRDAAAVLADGAGWNVMKTASSTSTVATATAGASALGGSLAINVIQLATSASVVSSGTASALSSVVTSGPLLVSAGGAALGVATFGGNAGLALGAHTMKVTQASTAATKTATTALAGSIVIGGGNNAFSVDIAGVTKNYTIQNGTYTPAGLAAAVQSASNGELTASVDGTGRLVLQTVAEGSAATLTLNAGGSALTDLGITAGDTAAPASAGTDGKIDVDGVSTTVSDVRAGVTVALPSTAGSITATLASGLRLGTVQAKNVDIGDGSLNAVVNAVNGANLGVTAAAVQSAPGQYKLQLASAGTGLQGAESMATGSINLGTFNSIGTAQDAKVTVGAGPGAFTVSSSSNQVSNLLPGVTISLATTGSTTITVSRDADALAANVGNLVDQANTVLKEIATQTSYDPDTQEAGLLIGDFSVRQLQSSIVNSIINSVSTSSVATAATAGVSVTKTGTFTFDKTKFVAAYTANPTEVAKLFQRGGSSASTNVSLATSTNKTQPGSYPVVITQAATQGQTTGTVLGGGTISGAETIDVRVGGATGTTISFSAPPGATLQSIADGLNQLAATNGVAVLASVQGNALVIGSTGYGANASFEVRSSSVAVGQTGVTVAAGVFETHAGTNVAGTINGVAATGIGRLLQAPPTDVTLAGLTLAVTATAAQVSGAGGTLNLGNFDYVPGVAQRIASAGTSAVDVVSGTLTAAINGRKSEIDDLDSQIEVWDRRLADRQAQLKKQFAAMETALSSMKQQSAWLSSQVNSLNANVNGGN
ncbi:MAG: flagellar hook-associated 2 domain protein [Acidimicrobiales bacterium]|nr:flagellar hook-associated 2 domain protein [Acidimicrobiales bacterium]